MKKLILVLALSLLVLLCGTALANQSGEISIEECEAMGHHEVIFPEIKPTCGKPGYTQYTYCYRCRLVLTDGKKIPALGHSEVAVQGYAPTCTTAGLTDGKACSTCGLVLEGQNRISALGHSEVADAGYAPTCTATGLTDGKHCTTCGEATIPQSVIPALGHKLAIKWGKEPNCTKDGISNGSYCKVCNVVIKEQEFLPAYGHDEIIIEAKPATCTKEGLTEGKYCYFCQTTLVEQQVVPSLGHTYEAEIKLPGCTFMGYKREICTVCGDNYIAENYGATGHNYSAWINNGNNTHSLSCTNAPCHFKLTMKCSLHSVTIGGEVKNVCTVCGVMDEIALIDVANASVKAIDAYALRDYSELRVSAVEAPFVGVNAAMTVGCAHEGEDVPFNGMVKVSAEMEIEEDFKLVRVDVTEQSERVETWTELPYTYEKGILSFETDASGLFLLLPAA